MSSHFVRLCVPEGRSVSSGLVGAKHRLRLPAAGPSRVDHDVSRVGDVLDDLVIEIAVQRRRAWDLQDAALAEQRAEPAPRWPWIEFVAGQVSPFPSICKGIIPRPTALPRMWVGSEACPSMTMAT